MKTKSRISIQELANMINKDMDKPQSRWLGIGVLEETMKIWLKKEEWYNMLNRHAKEYVFTCFVHFQKLGIYKENINHFIFN